MAALTLAAGIFASAAAPVFAAQTQTAAQPIDLDKKDCSISVDMRNGGNLILLKVAAVTAEDGYSYSLTNGFQRMPQAGAVIQQINGKTQANWAALARSFAAYAGSDAGSDSARTEQRAGSNMTLTFSNLTPGVYVVMQTIAANGYYQMDPFVVTIPNGTDTATGERVYNVNANPKMELEPIPPEEETPPPETPPETPPQTPPGTPTPPPSTPPQEVLGAVRGPILGGEGGSVLGATRLPQTGQLWLPVPIMAFAGLVLIVAGRMLKRG